MDREATILQAFRLLKFVLFLSEELLWNIKFQHRDDDRVNNGWISYVLFDLAKDILHSIIGDSQWEPVEVCPTIVFHGVHELPKFNIALFDSFFVVNGVFKVLKVHHDHQCLLLPAHREVKVVVKLNRPAEVNFALVQEWHDYDFGWQEFQVVVALLLG